MPNFVISIYQESIQTYSSVLGMKLNSIWWWGSISGALGNVNSPLYWYYLYRSNRSTWKLLVLDRNTWNHVIMCKLLVVDRITWHHMTEYKFYALKIITWNYNYLQMNMRYLKPCNNLKKDFILTWNNPKRVGIL